MTIHELERLINEWRSGGAEDDTPVMLATQSNYPLMYDLTDDVAVVYGDGSGDGPDDPYGRACEYDGQVSHVILCEGNQRHDEPYPVEHEMAALQEAGWGR